MLLSSTLVLVLVTPKSPDASLVQSSQVLLPMILSSKLVLVLIKSPDAPVVDDKATWLPFVSWKVERPTLVALASVALVALVSVALVALASVALVTNGMVSADSSHNIKLKMRT